LAKLPDDDLLRQVADVLAEIMSEGESLRLEAVAVKLALSKRSLQRRLQEHDTSFQELVDRVRHRSSLELLSKTDLSLDECADRLGFANVTAFRRAFVRWVGAPPGRFRKHDRALA
jgi:AraC-like DNA-binding protein